MPEPEAVADPFDASATDAEITKFVADCDAHYQSVTGKAMTAAGLDPIAIITAIIAIIAQMCPKPASALKAAASSKSAGTILTTRSATRVALMEQHPGVIAPFIRYNGNAIVEAVLATTVSHDEAKLQMGLDACAH